MEFQIFNSYGIDDIGSCIDFLVANGRWQKNKNTIVAKDLNLKGTKDKLIRLIEDRDLVDDLRDVVTETWTGIQLACRPNRRKRYE